MHPKPLIPLRRRLQKGGALITVTIFVAVMLILSGSLLQYTMGERRSNERNRLILRSRNMAENAAIYASEQLTTKLRRLRSPSKIAFEKGTNKIYPPPDDVLITENSKASDIEVKAGLTSNTGLQLIDPVKFPNDPNKGLQVDTATVQIIAKSTMRHGAIGEVTTYVEQDLAVDLTPLFQFGVFYNMDMEYGPGPDMTITGPVHTNGNLIARMQTGKTTTLEFSDRVSAFGGFYSHVAYKGSTWMADDSEDKGPGGTGALNFTTPTGSKVNIYDGTNWRDHFHNKTSGTKSSTPPTATNLAKFESFATTYLKGNLRTSVHQVSKLELPAVGTYDEATNPAGGREIIDKPRGSDSAELMLTKISRNAGLYIIVNPDDETRKGWLPNGNSVDMRPRSYRTWLHGINNDGTRTIKEVVLPGQPSYGDLNATVNNLPNSFRADTAVGHNRVLTIPKGAGVDLPGSGYTGVGYAAPDLPTFPAVPNAYFYDLRRATNNTGHPWNRSANNYRPRPVAKIDLDMVRFKMMVDRTYFGNATSTVYYPDQPVDATTWNASILNPSGAAAVHALGVAPVGETAFSFFPTSTAVSAVQATQTGINAPGSLVIESWTRIGAAGAVSALNCRFTVEETSDVNPYTGATWSAPVYTSAADESLYTYTPRTGITGIRVRQYLGGAAPAATNLCDEQIIPVVPDLAPLGVKTQTGAAGRFIIAETTDATPTAGGSWTNKYTSAADEISLAYVPGANVTGVRVKEYAAGGVVTLKRDQVIPLITASLTNSYATVPCSAGGASPVFSNQTVTEMRIFNGGVDDTINWTFTAATSAGVSGAFGTGLLANRYTVSGMSSTTTSTVTITAARTGYTSISRVFNLIKQSAAAVSGLGSNQQQRWTSVSRAVAPDPFKLYFADGTAVVKTDFTTPWADGISIYVHSVDAEDLSMSGSNRKRTDSGVRLWNGRGPITSLTDTGKTGFTLCTNDAVYVVGHFNANGTINTTKTDSAAYGGYSARYPDSAAEKLTAIMGDAITILSQPVFDSTYNQIRGWSDSLSAHRYTDYDSNYTTSWASTAPSGSNYLDGVNTSIKPSRLPFYGDISRYPGNGTAVREKLDPTATEISACLLTGIVRTTSGQTSGGVHNFPRLLEFWPANSGTTLAIRGSMVALFESQVATEPWSIRVYQGATRHWGLHNALRDAGHDVPLEPIVIGAHRLRYLELTAAQYEKIKGDIDKLPK
jgi:hypothetical protein